MFLRQTLLSASPHQLMKTNQKRSSLALVSFVLAFRPKLPGSLVFSQMVFEEVCHLFEAA